MSVFSFMCFLGVRYYSQLRYPFLKVFEGYYVEKIEVDPEYEKAKITWTMPKQPKTMIVPINKFKQIHHLNHKIDEELPEMLPFNVFEAGFDDNKFETLYRTIFLQVNEASNQTNFFKLFN